MRTHRQHSAFVLWCDRTTLEFVGPSTLCAARLEPVLNLTRGGVCLDLMFASGERIAVVPLVAIDGEMLKEYESSPFVWPHAVAEIMGHGRLSEIEAAVQPWIEALAFGRPLREEHVRVYASEFAGRFDRARTARFLGAAPYRDALLDIAPYVYAARFADGKRAGIRDAGGAAGAALLARYAQSVRADLGDPERNRLAALWYGVPLFGKADGDYDVAVVSDDADAIEAPVTIRIGGGEGEYVAQIATPVPSEVMVSFDPEDSPPARALAVACSIDVPLRAAIDGVFEAHGGSSGRIALIVRDDWQRLPDADGDEALELARRLRAEGFDAEIVAASAGADPSAFDLVHAIGLAYPQESIALLQAAHARGVPVVATPSLEDRTVQGAWGTGIVPVVMTYAHDETDLEDSLGMIARRRLEAPGLNVVRQEPFAGYENAVKTALSFVDAAVSSGEGEDALLRRLGFEGAILRGLPVIGAAPEPARGEFRAGTGDFVLAHAPIEPRCNQFLLLRAAAQAKLPLVLAGPIADPNYYASLRAFAGERVVFVPDADPALIAWLYRRARVFADVAWNRHGLHRIAAAAAAGCAPVVSAASYAAALWRPDVTEADPADPASIRSALERAWEGRREPKALADPSEAFVATVRAYAAAQERRAEPKLAAVPGRH